jgi:two-component system sensor kinase
MDAPMAEDRGGPTHDAAPAGDAERELDAVAAALSHDLRAPLRAIDGFSQILLADPGAALPEETRRFLALVREAGSELADLLDDLVEVVRVGRVALAARDGVDPARLARELVEAVLEPRARASGREVAWVVGEVPSCHADPALVRRLLEELLDNALKFGGRSVALSWDAAASAYAVADDGIGVDGELSEQAFAIFGRLHAREAYAGTGAGLAVARRIAERHGGRVWGRGAPGAGTTVWFTLGDRTR